MTEKVGVGEALSLQSRLLKATIASCTCGVKTLNVTLHEPECKFRIFEEALLMIRRLRGDAGLGEALKTMIICHTHYTGEPPYVGNEGIELALREHFDHFKIAAEQNVTLRNLLVDQEAEHQAQNDERVRRWQTIVSERDEKIRELERELSSFRKLLKPQT
jgi:hypothetical protein